MTELAGSESALYNVQGIQYQIVVQADETALQALVRESQLPEATLAEAAVKGALWVALKRGKGKTRPRRIRSLNDSVSQGSELLLNYDARVLGEIPQTMHRVADHVNYSIWFKPASMLCQGSKWSDHTVATTVAQSLCEKPCFLVHRLDKAACGLMLMAHTKNALRALTKMFEQREIEKTYFAVVCGNPEISVPLHIDEQLDGKSASTTVHKVEHHDNSGFSSLNLTIETGRKHQIRRHLSQLGYPLVGDRLYGNSDAEKDLQLVACQLSFSCPFTGEKIHESIDAEDALKGNLTHEQ